MKIPKRLIDCLNENKIRYETLKHTEAVTAQRIAQAEHVKGRHHAKVVMIKAGDQHVMAVLPADHQVDLQALKKILGKSVSLDPENEFKSLFPDCATGAMPPFGNLYDVPTYIDQLDARAREAKTFTVVFYGLRKCSLQNDAILRNALQIRFVRLPS